ncbi:amidohydrolase family protein [Streptomyces microflavus]|uniref:amidohydrolase family protein n=1 Tax=Streptomyces microflavus TaxID=1919 RepID=UPI002DD7DE4F|nr:amidohydrolase family protein [Streptomyces microflavus]WSA65209.1 amidohydrolase family protein [Streptomyces microflavus]
MTRPGPAGALPGPDVSSPGTRRAEDGPRDGQQYGDLGDTILERELDASAAGLAEAGISLTTVAPSSDLVLPIERLREHGVHVGLGSDGVRDSWSPFGDADMLHRAHLLARVQDARLDEELEAAFRAGADDGAHLLGLERADLRPGSPADFLLVRGECLPQVVVDLPRRELVVRGGRIVARDGELVGG